MQQILPRLSCDMKKQAKPEGNESSGQENALRAGPAKTRTIRKRGDILLRGFARWPSDQATTPDLLQIQLAQGWHCIGEGGAWDLIGLAAELGSDPVFSDRVVTGEHATLSMHTAVVVFSLEDDVFVAASELHRDVIFLRVWARSLDQAEAKFRELRNRHYREIKKPDLPRFFVLTMRNGEPDARPVTLQATGQSESDLKLNYGDSFLAWHQQFVKELGARRTGLSILQGPPGTGKTTYLRHLLYELRASHRFYYLPLSVYPMLCSPMCVDFWIDQNERYTKLTKIVVLEDAEGVLAQRHGENQEPLSNLLNIGDGFLGDFLRLHVICTINARIDKLDPAVLRPGRLIAAREFQKLPWIDAKRLADARGITLTRQNEEHSLAEIYATSKSIAPLTDAKRCVGFSVPE
jgi:ATPase family associated with various cellular activities (AAA)